jgi:hypothetical protein
MTKIALVLVIACGIVLGQLALEALGLLFEWTGKIVGKVIADRMQRLASAQAAGATREIKNHDART